MSERAKSFPRRGVFSSFKRMQTRKANEERKSAAVILAENEWKDDEYCIGGFFFCIL